MRIIHTSDWHLGRSLYGRKRYDEFAAFLDWLGNLLEAEGIDGLLVAGDIFDTSTPSNRAQELYYGFLCRVAASCCRHVVIIAGNHDSPSFLNAPKELLRALNVYVVGAMTGRPEDEVIVLKDVQGSPEAIVCAVPYLRDRDIRSVEPGETREDKNLKLVEGLKNHYAAVCTMAEQRQREFEDKGHCPVPIIAMGHLFTAGGRTVEGDGVRELYVGSLAHVGREVFPASIDYLALGHLHVHQTVGGAEYIRYSGSPIPMGFGEAFQEKKVVIVEFFPQTALTAPDSGESGKPIPHPSSIRLEKIPCFQPLERITGSLDEILGRLEQLKAEESGAWLEIEYTGSDIIPHLRELLDAPLEGSSMEIRRIKNKRIMDRVMGMIHEDETLDDLDVNDVFERCLDSFEVLPEDRPVLTQAYQEIVQSLREEDQNAE